MSSSSKTSTKPYTRRDALLAVGKYSVALSGAAVVALSAEEAAAQAACSRPNPPWWCNGGGNGNGNGNGHGNNGGNGRGNGRSWADHPDGDPQKYNFETYD
ncbi:hypothetical protein [Thalassovita litoralis]|uniref:hypothetical protein n=1 Tax=Thalassovita litoralis TaxID=1010611 RepID=UPI0011598E5E|nr:hypothetical protein [Thalassovita litoralis]